MKEARNANGSTAQADERRRHQRTVFFLVPAGHRHERLWVFKPADHADAAAAVILDAGGGGVRLLVEPAFPLNEGDYALRILLDARKELPAIALRLAWQEARGATGLKAGFSFVHGESSVEGVLQQAFATDRHVRCLLRRG